MDGFLNEHINVLWSHANGYTYIHLAEARKRGSLVGGMGGCRLVFLRLGLRSGGGSGAAGG